VDVSCGMNFCSHDFSSSWLVVGMN